MCSTYLCKKYKKTGIENFGYGKGYQYLAEEFADMLAKLTELQNSGMRIVDNPQVRIDSGKRYIRPLRTEMLEERVPFYQRMGRWIIVCQLPHIHSGKRKWQR